MERFLDHLDECHYFFCLALPPTFDLRSPMILSCLAIILIVGRSSSFPSNALIRKRHSFHHVCSSSTDEYDPSPSTRHRRKLEGKIPILSRTVPIETNEIPYVTIWELEQPSKLMERWWQAEVESAFATVDPFGVVMVRVSNFL